MRDDAKPTPFPSPLALAAPIVLGGVACGFLLTDLSVALRAARGEERDAQLGEQRRGGAGGLYQKKTATAYRRRRNDRRRTTAPRRVVVVVGGD